MSAEVVAAGFASPPTSPTRPLSYQQRPLSHHQPRPSIASVSAHRGQQSLSRFTDGVTSRSSEEDVPRTAVRVAVRVRPALQPTDPGYDLIPQRFRQQTCEVPTSTSLSVQSPQGKKLFVFDRVFPEDTTQDGIWEYLSDSVSSFIKGYNVSILAYGQSGSGKSHTMGTSSPDEQLDPKIMGIIPRAAQTLFERLNGSPSSRQSGLPTPKTYSTSSLPTLHGMSKANGRGGGEPSWTLKATYVEIYQEQLRDLLISEAVPMQDRAQVAIREDTKGRILVTGLTQVAIHSVEDMLRALSFGSSIRQTDTTNLNARSSRSHAVFSLNLVQKKPDVGGGAARADHRPTANHDTVTGAESVVTIDSNLHFVDLAGSERLKNTGATGDRAKEGISINAGLASLGKVISQLSTKNGSAHISYRDSRLTRLLQDSLGGNAITFMVACVTPAVFHLSETLNTVHYAQRARAIQSKPEIQQTHEEGDKQAVIDRLRAEISFLRDQIRHSENPETKSDHPRGRPDRSTRGREVELQQEVMDMHENYNALSQRHAKLISDLSQARSNETEMPELSGAIGENAMDRIKRSNSFAEAVEQMVLEYEKTIQSLESSLSKTRSTLSNSESTLMEKETRIAYMETIQQQLQARIQKALDREQSSEAYLHNLEARMEGSADGEEKNVAVIDELRRELARARESENNAEDYITTLEERLADAEQDQEIMQREIDRLEHVVERQRSIGRLDSLLGELDEIRSMRASADEDGDDRATTPDEPRRQPASVLAQVNGIRKSYDPFRPDSLSASSAYSTNAARHGAYADDLTASEANGDTEATTPTLPEYMPPLLAPMGSHPSAAGTATTTQQSDIMGDKLENLTQELFDLRSEHESVMVDYDKLQQKYKTALETLAKLEYEKEASSPRSVDGTEDASLSSARGSNAFLANGHKEESDERSSSRQSSALEPSSLPPPSELVSTDKEATIEEGEIDPAQIPLPEEDPEIEELRVLHAEKEAVVAELTNNYNALMTKHESSLAQIEDLRRDAQRTPTFRPGSQSFNKSLFRRKSEDLLSNMDARVSRALAALKNVAQDNFDDDIDIRQAFDINVNTIISELQARAERIFALEGEMSTVRLELDAKQTIIMGLTRERSSLKAASTVDFSVVGQMQEQLKESENQIRALHEQHDVREKNFLAQIESLQTALTAQAHQPPTPVDDVVVSTDIPGGFPVTPNDEAAHVANGGMLAPPAGDASAASEHAQSVARLQQELSVWEFKHHTAMSSMQATEAELLGTIASLEASLQSVRDSAASPDPAAAVALEEERTRHHEVAEGLQREVENYRSVAHAQNLRLEELQASYEGVVQRLEQEASREPSSRDSSAQQLQAHRELVANLENQVAAHQTALAQQQDSVAQHQAKIETLQQAHAREIQDLEDSTATAERESRARYFALEKRHLETSEQLSLAHGQHADLLRSASSALGYDTDASLLHGQIRALIDEGRELHHRHLKSSTDLQAVKEDLRTALTGSAELEAQLDELKNINEETLKKLGNATERDSKNSRLIDELEEQLNSNFDSHKAATNRLSLMQDEVTQQRIELERELEEQKLRNSQLEQQVLVFQRQSVTSNASVARDSISPEIVALGPLGSSAQSSMSQPATQPPTGQPGSARKPAVTTSLPTPPPSIPLPPLPSSPATGPGVIANGIDAWATSNGSGVAQAVIPTGVPSNISPPGSRHISKDSSTTTPSSSSSPPQQPNSLQQQQSSPTSNNPLSTANHQQQLDEQEARIRTIEKHLFAEKQLTATLEEALVDLETSANRTKAEMEAWRKKCAALEDELVGLRKDQNSDSRASLQAVEEEREMRLRAERARQALEQRMMELGNNGKKKKKSSLNCF